jgi:hypothetical protein
MAGSQGERAADQGVPAGSQGLQWRRLGGMYCTCVITIWIISLHLNFVDIIILSAGINKE